MSFLIPKPAYSNSPSRHNTGTLATLVCAVLLLSSSVALSQEKVDLEAAGRIRDAAFNHSQIMDMVGYLTDVTGPRLTGSPNLKFDYGTGRIRGVFLQGNEAARPVLRASLGPFNDLGAATLSIAGAGATDHMSFDEIGLPGFQWIRDYMEGNDTRAPHTNMDTYDHVLEDDLKQSAAVAAFVIYDLAMPEEKLPRKPLPSP